MRLWEGSRGMSGVEALEVSQTVASYIFGCLKTGGLLVG